MSRAEGRARTDRSSWMRSVVAAVATTLIHASFASAQTRDDDPCATSSVQPGSLSTVVARSLQGHPALRGAEQELAVRSSRALAAEGAFDPVTRATTRQMIAGTYRDHESSLGVSALTPWAGLRVGAGYRWHAGSFAPYYGMRETGSAGEASLSAELPLLEGRAIDPARAGVRLAELDLDVAQEAVAFERLRVAREAVAFWWQWRAAIEVLRVRQDLLLIAEERARMVSARVASGDLAPVEDVEARRTLLQRRNRVVEAERDVDVAAAQLAFWMRDGAGAMTLPDRCEAPPWPSAAAPPPVDARATPDVNESRPDLRAFALRIEAADLRVDLARNTVLPTLDVSGWFAHNVGAELPRPDPTDAGIALRFELPLFNRAARGRRDAAAAEADQLAWHQRVAVDAAQRDVEIAQVRLDRARERHTIVREEVETLRTLEQAERVAWRMGESTLFLVNLRETATAEALELEAAALRDVYLARIDLLSALGIEPQDWAASEPFDASR